MKDTNLSLRNILIQMILQTFLTRVRALNKQTKEQTNKRTNKVVMTFF